MINATAMIMAGGLGTRLRPLTETTPKCLIEVGGKPLLDYWVEALATAGVNCGRVNTHHLRDRVVAHLKKLNAASDFHLEESWEPELLGSAGTISANADLGENADAVIVIYADNLSDANIGQMLRFHAAHGEPVTMLVFEADEPKRCGIAEIDDSGLITAFVEKPEEPKSNLANGGVYVIDSKAWREIADLGGFDIGFDVLPRFVGRMKAYRHPGYHLDIGTHESLAKAEQDIANGVLRPKPMV